MILVNIKIFCKLYFFIDENTQANKSSASATPRKSQKQIGIKCIEFLESDSQNLKNYFVKKNTNKSPNMTYLSLDTSQTYEK